MDLRKITDEIKKFSLEHQGCEIIKISYMSDHVLVEYKFNDVYGKYIINL